MRGLQERGAVVAALSDEPTGARVPRATRPSPGPDRGGGRRGGRRRPGHQVPRLESHPPARSTSSVPSAWPSATTRAPPSACSPAVRRCWRVVAVASARWLAWLAPGGPANARVSLALGLVLGGALGTWRDRVFRGHHGAVVDFITLTHWPTFNVADAASRIGVVLLVLFCWLSACATGCAMSAHDDVVSGRGRPCRPSSTGCGSTGPWPCWPDVSRAAAAELVAAGRVLVDGRVVTRAIDAPRTSGAPSSPGRPRGRPAGLQRRPRGRSSPSSTRTTTWWWWTSRPALVVHPGAGRSAGTLVAGLLARYPELAELPARERGRPSARASCTASTGDLGAAGGGPQPSGLPVAGRPSWRRAPSSVATWRWSQAWSPRTAGWSTRRSAARPGRPTAMTVAQPRAPGPHRLPGAAQLPRPGRATLLSLPSRPGGPTRSGSTWRPSATRWWATTATAPGAVGARPPTVVSQRTGCSSTRPARVRPPGTGSSCA